MRVPEMSDYSIFALIGVGGLFILLGLGSLFWGRSEEKGYYKSMSTRRDIREYLDHWPRRPQFGALQTGGWISIVLGLIMVITGSVFWFRG
jgi:hypothetical protein